MKEDVAELVKLYEDGNKASSKFGKLQDAIVPYRTPQALSMPQMVKNGPLGIPTFAYPTPEPEHPQTADFFTISQAVCKRLGKGRGSGAKSYR